jgi:hypothetical protein
LCGALRAPLRRKTTILRQSIPSSPAKHAENAFEEYRDARKVVVGDLTRDGVPETGVLYTIESQRGTNNYVQYVAVFGRGNGRLVAVTHAEVGGKSTRSVELTSVDNNTIHLET